VLRALALPERPDERLDGLARALDDAYRQAARRLDVSTAVGVDAAGRLPVGALRAIEGPESLAELRRLSVAMLPRVSAPEVRPGKRAPPPAPRARPRR
jgi:hypothetical protein